MRIQNASLPPGKRAPHVETSDCQFSTCLPPLAAQLRQKFGPLIDDHLLPRPGCPSNLVSSLPPSQSTQSWNSTVGGYYRTISRHRPTFLSRPHPFCSNGSLHSPTVQCRSKNAQVHAIASWQMQCARSVREARYQERKETSFQLE